MNPRPVAPRARWRRSCWWWLLAPFGTPSITYAQPDPSAEVLAELELTADPRCATRAELVRRIRVRSDRIRFVAETPGSRTLKARISPGPGSSQRATLALVQPGRGSLSRTVVARSCEEALDALALIAAVSLDPLASTEPEPEDSPSSAASEASAEGSDVAKGGGKSGTAASESPGRSLPTEGDGDKERPKPTAETVDPQEEPADVPEGETPPSPKPVPLEPPWMSRAGTPSVLVGLLGGVLFGPAPELMPGASAFVALDWEDAGIWTPALRLSVSRHLRKGIAELGGTAEFSLDQLAVEVCPLRLWRGRLSLRPCLFALGGQLYAAGSETEAQASETRPWWALGASAILFFKASERLLAVARLGGGYPLIRDTFEFKPEPFHQVPPITLEASLGVAFRFP